MDDFSPWTACADAECLMCRAPNTHLHVGAEFNFFEVRGFVESGVLYRPVSGLFAFVWRACVWLPQANSGARGLPDRVTTGFTYELGASMLAARCALLRLAFTSAPILLHTEADARRHN